MENELVNNNGYDHWGVFEQRAMKFRQACMSDIRDRGYPVPVKSYTVFLLGKPFQPSLLFVGTAGEACQGKTL
jgi:hypothetical protein